MAVIAETPQGRRNERRLLELKIAKLHGKQRLTGPERRELELLEGSLKEVNQAIVNDALFNTPAPTKLREDWRQVLAPPANGWQPRFRSRTTVFDCLNVPIDVGDILVLSVASPDAHGLAIYRVLREEPAGTLVLSKLCLEGEAPVQRATQFAHKGICLSWYNNHAIQPTELMSELFLGRGLDVFAAWQKAGQIA